MKIVQYVIYVKRILITKTEKYGKKKDHFTGNCGSLAGINK